MRKFFLLALAALAVPAVASAQSASGSIQARARVLGAITVSPVTTLDFGDFLSAGATKTVAPADATSGEFAVAGDPGAQLLLTFDFPATLDNGLNQITLGANAWNVNVGATRAGSASLIANGADGANANSFLSAGGSLGVFVGGEATAAAGLPAGVYTGTVGLTAAYTGL
jgi:hypothetical protein